jgi:hypothetical protein
VWSRATVLAMDLSRDVYHVKCPSPQPLSRPLTLATHLLVNVREPLK